MKHLFFYRLQELHAVKHVWGIVHPYESIIAAESASYLQDIDADRVRYENTAKEKIAHLIQAE